jgi:hypothetical protein
MSHDLELWDEQRCKEVLHVFETCRRDKELEFDGLLMDAEREQHRTINTYLEALERLEKESQKI